MRRIRPARSPAARGTRRRRAHWRPRPRAGHRRRAAPRRSSPGSVLCLHDERLNTRSMQHAARTRAAESQQVAGDAVNALRFGVVRTLWRSQGHSRHEQAQADGTTHCDQDLPLHLDSRRVGAAGFRSTLSRRADHRHLNLLTRGHCVRTSGKRLSAGCTAALVSSWYTSDALHDEMQFSWEKATSRL